MTHKHGLGDAVAAALKLVGITPDVVASWVGGPCGCEERRQKLNAVGAWAARVLSGKTAAAAEYLARIMS